MATAAAGTLPY